MILRAKFIVPVHGPVIEGGALRIEDGRIAAYGSAGEVTGRPVTDFGDAVIVPGFVNAHTHLELSWLAGRVEPTSDFIAWLNAVVRSVGSEQHTRETVCDSVRRGIQMSLDAGVTLVGDVTRQPQWTRDVLAASALQSVSFGEVIAIGCRRHLLQGRLSAAVSTPGASPRARVGISPHAPYTVEPDALRACADRALEAGLPMCVHLGESQYEEEFTRTRTGPFEHYLRKLDVWDEQIPASGIGPVELCASTGVLRPQTVIAHGNYVTDDDIATIARCGSSVAYCPRTHAAFGHAPHRFLEMTAAGVNVCIGTDSLASNPSLSILDELRFIRRKRNDVPAETLLAMGTLNGARALGCADVTGAISVGKSADLAVIPLESSAINVGWHAMFESDLQPLAVYVAGRCSMSSIDPCD